MAPQEVGQDQPDCPGRRQLIFDNSPMRSRTRSRPADVMAGTRGLVLGTSSDARTALRIEPDVSLDQMSTVKANGLVGLPHGCLLAHVDVSRQLLPHKPVRLFFG